MEFIDLFDELGFVDDLILKLKLFVMELVFKNGELLFNELKLVIKLFDLIVIDKIIVKLLVI